ncbi:MAG TPA: RNA polymerase sigma factor [Solirubrobacteraceae bacterium]|nr:RNA polymerase sigma factor [Solirubrobacteraceae bacterium]
MSDRDAAGSVEDTQLLQQARDGRAEAFEVLYRRHNRVVLAFLARRVAQPELAADLLAETFAALLVVVRDPTRRLPESPIAWLLGTARHLLIDSYRRGRVEAAARTQLAMQPLVLDDGDLRRIEEISAETDILAELAAVLPPEQFAALRARVIDESDYATIARELRCSEAVVRKRVSRALRTLRTANPEAEGNA